MFILYSYPTRVEFFILDPTKDPNKSLRRIQTFEDAKISQGGWTHKIKDQATHQKTLAEFPIHTTAIIYVP